MNAPAPRISILIATLNSGRTLRPCLESIRAQDYPAEALEIVVADGGSTDDTLDIARDCGVTRVVPNPLKTGEAGKSAAAAAATGEIFALVDSDNILPDRDWLATMAAPFADPEVVASEPLHYTRRAEDGDLTRYFAMLGMTDPLCLFIGNYDRHCAVTGKWTEIPMETADQGGWIKVFVKAGRPTPTFGANGFLIRRNALAAVAWQPYWFDVDVMNNLPSAPTQSHAQPLPKRDIAACLKASWNFSIDPKLRLIASARRPSGWPPPGVITLQNKVWLKCPPALLRTASGKRLISARMSSGKRSSAPGIPLRAFNRLL